MSLVEHNLFGEDYESAFLNAIARPLDKKIECAIDLLREYLPLAYQTSADGYWCCNSGGKDSVVITHLLSRAVSRKDYQIHYNNVTIDPPELIWFLRKNYPDAIWHNVGIPLPRYMVLHGKPPPTRMLRWCCKIYKEEGGNDRVKVLGVRASESKRRKGTWREVTYNRQSRAAMINPILYWTDEDVWNYIRMEKIPYCNLYDPPYSAKRIGCIGCPMGSHRKREFERWPRYEAMWKKAIRDLWTEWKDIPRRDGKPRMFARFKNPGELWNWWMEEEMVNDTDQPDCQMWLW